MIFMHYVCEHKLLENKTGQAKNKILEKNPREMMKGRAQANNAWQSPHCPLVVNVC